VVAVLTPDAPDVLSHVSVRARNMRVLFATCHDAEPLDQIRNAQGQFLHFSTTAAGAVTWVSPSLMCAAFLGGVIVSRFWHESAAKAAAVMRPRRCPARLLCLGRRLRPFTAPVFARLRNSRPNPTLRTIDSLSGADGATPGLPQATGAPRNLRITIPKWCGRWAVGMDEFKDGVVGAKSRNIANLRGKLPDWVKLPAAVTVPFGSFEKVGP
jgi:hypothetical protein